MIPQSQIKMKPLGLAPHTFLAKGSEMVEQVGVNFPYPIDMDVLLRNAGLPNDKNSNYLPLMVNGHLWISRSKGGETRFHLVLDEVAFAELTKSDEVSVYPSFF